MIIKILIALMVFMLVVTVHEFGHFIVAKKSKIKVNEFAVGMGPKIFGKQKGETLYSVRALPLGGCCAMEGEDESDTDGKSFSETGNFNQAPIGGRIFTIFAGPLFNFILAFVIMFGLFVFRGYQTNVIADVTQNSVAQRYGLKSGDKIVKIDDKEISKWKDIQNTLSTLTKDTIKVVVSRNNVQKEFDIKFDDSNEKLLGISSKLDRNVFVSLREATNTVFYFIGSMFDVLRQLITGKVGVGQLSGPIGVVGAISSAASNGIYSLLYITAFISVNLGFINLLPIPALDGGRLVFLIIEMIIGRPVSRSKEGLIHTIGFIFLMCLILLVSFKDVIRLGIFGAN